MFLYAMQESKSSNLHNHIGEVRNLTPPGPSGKKFGIITTKMYYANIDGSFTVGVSNSFLGLQDILQIIQENNYLGIF